MSPKLETAMVPPVEVRSYYDRPILKRPVWKWPIPAYLFTGGLAGASSVLALGARAAGDDRLARGALITSATSIAASAGFLVADLGRPKRFVNMLRVVRPTSPMSMGSWLLSAFGPAAGTAAVGDVLGVLPRLSRAAEIGAGALGPVVTTYTAVLLADTAIPVWHEARGELPFVFGASAVASAGAAALLHTPSRGASAARRVTVLGSLAELASTRLMERRLGALAEPYHHGRTKALSKSAQALLGAGVATVALAGRRSRAASALGGVLVLAGSALGRFAIFDAGFGSAADPRYVVGPQRERLDAAAAC